MITHRPSSVRPLSVVNFPHFQFLPRNCWMEFEETWQQASTQRPLPRLCFRTDRKIKVEPFSGIWSAETFWLLGNRWTEFQETLQEASTQHPLPSLFFWSIGKQRWHPWPLIDWDMVDFSVNAEWSLTKPDRKQVLIILYHVCLLLFFIGPILQRPGKPSVVNYTHTHVVRPFGSLVTEILLWKYVI